MDRERRDQWLADVFPELADTLIDDFDLVDFLTILVERTAELLDATEVSLVLAENDGSLRTIASSTERVQDVELLEVQAGEGPCHDALRTGNDIVNVDLDHADTNWPRFGPRARALGYNTVHAVPMRLRDRQIGAVNIFDTRHRALDMTDLSLARAFANVATIGILQQRSLKTSRDLATELQHALISRVGIEQAKGFVAERLGVSTNEAFVLLRRHARNSNIRLAEVAADITNHRLAISALRGAGA